MKRLLTAILVCLALPALAARVTTIRTSIYSGSKADEPVNIIGVSWSGDNGTITLASAPSAAAVVGDVVFDDNGNGYLITAIAGAVLTAQDFDTTTDPVTGGVSAYIDSAYSSMVLWEAALDNTPVYAAGDDAIGECYKGGGNYTASVTVNGGGTVGLNSITLTAASGEQHDGTAGTGVRIYGAYVLTFRVPNGIDATVSYLELNKANGGVAAFLLYPQGAATTLTMQRNLIYNGRWNPASFTAVVLQNQFGAVNCNNNIIYDFEQFLNHATTWCTGIMVDDAGGVAGTIRVQNNTIDRIYKTNGSAPAYGIYWETDVGSGTRTDQNNLVTDVNGTTTGSKLCFRYPATQNKYTINNNASSDATAIGTGSLTGITPDNQYVSRVLGSEDYHLQAGADAIDAAADLGTSPPDVNIDIDGYDRDSEPITWDIGAHEYQQIDPPRITDVICSIINGGKTPEAVTVTTVDWLNGHIYLSAAISVNAHVGDTITDSGGNSFLITATNDGTYLTAQDFDTATDPATGAGTIQEAFTTITLWEDDLDDPILYRAGDDATAECYDDGGAFVESPLINGGNVIGLNSVMVTVPAAERHDGTAGTGTQMTGGFTAQKTTPDLVIEWLNMTTARAYTQTGASGTTPTHTFRNNLVHDGLIAGSGTRYAFDQGAPFPADVMNNIFYALECSDADGSIIGIRILNNGKALNNTVHDLRSGGNPATFAYNYWYSDFVAIQVKNNIGTDPSAGTGTTKCFVPSAPATATANNNMSSDDTAPGTGSLINKLASRQFISVAIGSEDLHLRQTSAAIHKAADLGTTPAGVNIDIDGYDRDAGGEPWDIGADTFTGPYTRRKIIITW